MPIYLNFCVARETNSPYLGKSFLLAPLDSNFVQVDDNNFIMLQPNGLWTQFTRDNKEPTVLHGPGLWQAVINGDTITAWPGCGGKMVFNQGKLVSMSFGTHQLNLAYSGGKVSEIQEGGKTLLMVDTDSQTGSVTGLDFGGQHFGIKETQRPQVEVVGGQKLIGAMEESLGKLTFPNGIAQEFEFAVDKQMNPTLKITAGGVERLMTWDVVSKQILADSDGNWIYDIRNGKDEFANAAIGRTNRNNTFEYWYDDVISGVEITQNTNGLIRVANRFVSGILAGKVRSVRLMDGQRVVSREKIDYNEYGQMARAVTESKDETRVTTPHYSAEHELQFEESIIEDKEIKMRFVKDKTQSITSYYVETK
jgi:hypothetical protein